mgnify:CR=1 FL=1
MRARSRLFIQEMHGRRKRALLRVADRPDDEAGAAQHLVPESKRRKTIGVKEIEAVVAQSQKRSAVFDVVTNPTNVTVRVI